MSSGAEWLCRSRSTRVSAPRSTAGTASSFSRKFCKRHNRARRTWLARRCSKPGSKVKDQGLESRASIVYVCSTISTSNDSNLVFLHYPALASRPGPLWKAVGTRRGDSTLFTFDARFLQYTVGGSNDRDAVFEPTWFFSPHSRSVTRCSLRR